MSGECLESRLSNVFGNEAHESVFSHEILIQVQVSESVLIQRIHVSLVMRSL